MSTAGRFPTEWREISWAWSQVGGDFVTYMQRDDNLYRIRQSIQRMKAQKAVTDTQLIDEGSGVYKAVLRAATDGSKTSEQLDQENAITWSVESASVQLSVFESDKSRELEEAYPGVKAYVSRKSKDFLKNPVVNDGPISVPGITDQADIDKANDLYFLLIQGVDSFTEDVPVLKKTTVLPPGSLKVLEWGNSGRLFSDTQLAIAEPTIPNGIKTGLPQGFYRKRRPTCSQAVDGTLEANVTYEYVGLAYSNYLYEQAS